MKRKWTKLLLFFWLTISTYATEENLIILLPTSNSLVPVAVNSSSSLENLSNILIDDLNLNGSCYVVEKNDESQFCVRMKLVDKKLSVSLESIENGFCTNFPLEHICPSSIRTVIHKISDQITEAITGIRGIASNKILFSIQYLESSSEGLEYKSEIWESDYDGKNKKQITNEKNYCISPVFFPRDGAYTQDKFLYVSYKQGQSKIYLRSFSDNKETPFIKLKGNQLLPSVSEKGNMIAFISDVSGKADLFAQFFCHHNGLLGKPIQLFSHPQSVQASPTFRPDGKKIAFVSDKDGTPRIYLINSPSLRKKLNNKPICITKKYRHNTSPNWSPDGLKLAYSAMVDGSRQIMVYDFLLQKEIQLTNGKVHKENPCWAKNSLHIIYNTVASSSGDLFIIDLNRKKPKQITAGPGKKHYPAWEQKK